MSILPNILDVAIKHNIEFSGRNVSGRAAEKTAVCPFHKQNRRQYHLYINAEKNTFKCQACGEKGGVLKFISLLENRSEQDILAEIKGQIPARSKKPSHPALTLNGYQLKLMDIQPRSNWPEWWNEDPTFKFWWLNQIWERWQGYVQYEIENSLVTLYIALMKKNYLAGIERIKKKSQEMGVDLLGPCIKAFSSPTPPFWVLNAKRRAKIFYESNLKTYNNPTAGKKAGVALNR